MTSKMFLFQLKCGFFVNIICIAVNFMAMTTYATLMFDLDEFPDWADKPLGLV